MLVAVDSFGPTCFASLKSIADRTGAVGKAISRRQTCSALQTLVRLDLLDKQISHRGQRVEYAVIWQNLLRHCSDDLAREMGAGPLVRRCTGAGSRVAPVQSEREPVQQLCTRILQSEKPPPPESDTSGQEEVVVCWDEETKQRLRSMFGPTGAPLSDEHRNWLTWLLLMDWALEAGVAEPSEVAAGEAT